MRRGMLNKRDLRVILSRGQRGDRKIMRLELSPRCSTTSIVAINCCQFIAFLMASKFNIVAKMLLRSLRKISTLYGPV